MLNLEPSVLTIFGITGDLAGRYLLPAIYHLAHDEHLPETFRIVGVSRRGTTPDDVVNIIKSSVESRGDECDHKTLDYLKSVTAVVDMHADQTEEYVKLADHLNEIEKDTGMCLNRLFHLAIPSNLFGFVASRLGGVGLNNRCIHGAKDSRLLIEKPFGYDLDSAKELIESLHIDFKEEQIYRIDHYLAKETVQNLLTFRFENPLFSNAWNNSLVDHVIVTVAEEIDIEGRTSFYEQMGAMRDMLQSHMMQLLSLILMEEPKKIDSEQIHKVKEAALKKIATPKANEMTKISVRGQYDGYKKEVDNDRSETETFAALKLWSNASRWRGVPFYLRTGKSLPKRATEIIVVFRTKEKPEKTNYLTLRIQPNEGIVVEFRIKKPGYEHKVENVQMDFCYSEKVDATHPDAYERILVDTMRGDKTLFATSIEIIESWRIIQPVLDAWWQGRVDLKDYEKGSWGPQASFDLARSDNIHWRTDTTNVCTVHIVEN